MNDALHGRETWRRPGKRDRWSSKRGGEPSPAPHHGPGNATPTPFILVRIQVPSHESSRYRFVFSVSAVAGIASIFPRVSTPANASAVFRDAKPLGAGLERPPGLSRPFSGPGL